ncbi:beta strand repeat-containing protein, partial [Patescibacteria group bacterium]
SKEDKLIVLNEDGEIDEEYIPTGSEDNDFVQGDDDRLHNRNEDIGTESLTFNLGKNKAVSNNFELSVSNSSSKPALRYSGATSSWQYSNDGVTYSDIGSATGSYLDTTGGTMTGNITFNSTQTFGGSSLTELGYLNTLTLTAGSLPYAASSTALTSLNGVAGDDGEFLKFTWSAGVPTLSWATVGTFDDFTLSGDSGTDQTIADGNTLEIAGGANISTVASATDTITINLGSTISGTTWNGSIIGVAYGGTGIDTSSSTGVPTISSGTWSVSSTLGVATGGTGLASYTVGDLIYASGTTTLAKLAGVATGNSLISGGVGTAPSWGKIGLTTHISGILGVANGGTGTSTQFTTGSMVFAGASGVYSQDNTNLFWDDGNNYLGIGTATPTVDLDVNGTIKANNYLTSGGDPVNDILLPQDIQNYSINSLKGSVGLDMTDNMIEKVSPTVFESASTSRSSATSLENGNVLIAYSDFGNSEYGTFVIYDSTGAQVKAPTVFESSDTPVISTTTLTNGNVLIAYRDGGNSNYGTFAIYDFTGTQVKAPEVFESASTSAISATTLTNGNVLIAYRDAGNLNYGTFTIYDSAGAQVKAATVFESASADYISATALTNGNVWIAYADGGNSGYGTFTIYDSTGTQVKAPTVFESANTSYSSATTLLNGNVLIAYADVGNSSYGTFTIYDSTGAQLKAPTVFESDDIIYGSATTLANGNVLIAYVDGGNSNYGTFTIYDSAGAQVKAATVFESASVSNISAVTLSNGNVLTAYTDAGNSSYGTFTIYEGEGAYFSGKVGIGTTTPTAELDIDYNSATTTAGSYYGSRSDVDFTGTFTTGTTNIYGMYGDATAGYSTGGTVNTYGGYFVASGDNSGDAAANAYGLYVDGATGADNNYSAIFMNGNVGIGTVTPTVDLDVSGTIKAYNYLTGGGDPVNDILLPQDIQNYSINSLKGSVGLDMTDNMTEKVAATVFESAAVSSISTTTLKNGNVLIAYQDEGNSDYGTFAIYDSAGAQVIAPTVFESATTNYVSATTLTSGNILIAYQDGGNSYYGTFTIYDSAGNQIVAPTVFESATTNYVSATTLTSGNTLIAYQDVGNSNYGTFVIYDSAGNQVKAPTVFESAAASYTSATSLTSGDILIAYQDGGNSSYGTFVIYDSVGNQVKAPTVFESAIVNYVYPTTLANGNSMIVYQDVGNSSYGTFVIYDSVGNQVKAPTVFESAATSFISTTALTNGNILITYTDLGNSNYGTFTIYDSVGTQVEAPTVFESASTNYSSPATLTNGNVLIAYKDIGNSDYGTFVIYEGEGAYFSGKVGIGTSTPSYMLDVVGAANVIEFLFVDANDSSEGGQVTLRGGAGGYADWNLDVLNNDPRLFTSSTADNILQVFNNGSGVVDMWLEGNLGIGSAATGPTHLIELDSDTYGTTSGWTDASDRNKKENFMQLSDVTISPVGLGVWSGNGSTINAIEYKDGSNVSLNIDEFFNRIAMLPIMQWNFIDDGDYNKMGDGEIKHIGPMAQDFYKLFGLGASDTNVKATDMAGVALFGVKGLLEKTTDNKLEIENVTLKTDQNATTLGELQSSVDDQLVLVGLTINDISALDTQQSTIITEIENSIAENLDLIQTQIDNQLVLENTLQEQIQEIEELKTQDEAILDFMLAINTDNFITKDEEGNVTLEGNLKAEIVEGKGFVITIDDEEYPTIGRAIICSVIPIDEDNDDLDDCSGNAIPKDSDEDGNDDLTSEPMPLDEDGDWIDDNTQEGIVNDGKSVFVETSAVSEDSEIFVTSRSSFGGSLFVSEIEESDGFEVMANEVASENIELSWWIVESSL